MTLIRFAVAVGVVGALGGFGGAGCSSDAAAPNSETDAGAGSSDAGNGVDGNVSDGSVIVADACSGSCGAAVCGNGVKDAGEQCDDTNTADGDGCSHDCKFERCGDGIVNDGEACDPGAPGVDTATCNSDCTTATCGDGKINKIANEQCDDGASNNADNKDCTSHCHINACGDGLVDTAGPTHFEGCDGGPLHNDPGCNDAFCVTKSCGNGFLEPGEACDDGNRTDNDDCTNGCNVARCGDGIVASQGSIIEECDNGVSNAYTADCLPDCHANTCGDGFLDTLGPGHTEACDRGANNGVAVPCDYGIATCPTCDPTFCNLTFAVQGQGNVCGDGVVDPDGHEVCDDGNANACGTCNASCSVAQSQAASGAIFASDGADLNDGDTFTLSDGFVTKTFELTNGTPGAGNIKITHPAASSNTAMASAIKTAIDNAACPSGGAPCLAISAPSVSGAEVVLVNQRATSFGNVAITKSAGITSNFNVVGMSGGLGGDCSNATGCKINDDCSSAHCDNTGGGATFTCIP